MTPMDKYQQPITSFLGWYLKAALLRRWTVYETPYQTLGHDCYNMNSPLIPPRPASRDYR